MFNPIQASRLSRITGQKAYQIEDLAKAYPQSRLCHAQSEQHLHQINSNRVNEYRSQPLGMQVKVGAHGRNTQK